MGYAHMTYLYLFIYIFMCVNWRAIYIKERGERAEDRRSDSSHNIHCYTRMTQCGMYTCLPSVFAWGVLKDWERTQSC